MNYKGKLEVIGVRVDYLGNFITILKPENGQQDLILMEKETKEYIYYIFPDIPYGLIKIKYKFKGWGTTIHTVYEMIASGEYHQQIEKDVK